MDIIDTHQHLWDPAKLSYSWCAGIPVLNRAFLPDDYQAAVSDLPDGVRIVQSVHVEADVDEPFMADETRWILSVAEDPKRLTKAVVAPCRPELDNFDAYLDAIAHPRLKGVRRVLHTMPDDHSRGELFVRNVGSLHRRGLTFDLCVKATQLPAAIDLVRRCPDTRFILDHCGVPDVKAKALDPWRDRIREIAKLPNVVACKISGLVAYADPQHWTANDLRPFIDHAIASFGYDRVMFGSDWPVCTLSAPLRGWLAALLDLTASASPDERDRLFRRNAIKVYRLDPTPRETA
ncbi:MAG: amidohydrolase [Planctomycetota bacterium]|nr:amidohydrolase [Planctomycetota bacterium]